MVAQRPHDREELVGGTTAPEPDSPKQGPKWPTTQERRAKLDAFLWGGIVLSVLAHVAFFSLRPTFDAPDISFQAGELEVLEVPPEIEVPPPPAAIQRPAVPVVAQGPEVDPDITISPTTFAANPVEELPPPPEEEETDRKDLYDGPTFTPYTVAPEMANRKEAAQAVLREWPNVLKNAGVGGVTVVWIFIDEEGEVLDARISQESGISQLDDAALRAVHDFEFTPAMNREKKVQVWVELPITFTLQDGTRTAG